LQHLVFSSSTICCTVVAVHVSQYAALQRCCCRCLTHICKQRHNCFLVNALCAAFSCDEMLSQRTFQCILTLLKNDVAIFCGVAYILSLCTPLYIFSVARYRDSFLDTLNVSREVEPLALLAMIKYSGKDKWCMPLIRLMYGALTTAVPKLQKLPYCIW
jgi:hypothetical protein